MPQLRTAPLALLVCLCCSALCHAAAFQVFTNRAAWESALTGYWIQTETFNDFDGFNYSDGSPLFQFPAGVTDVGLLRFEVERPSGNLIVGRLFENVDGTTYWRVEAETQNGSTPPVTPALLFSQDVYGFGADWRHMFTPRSTMTFGPHTIHFKDYMGPATGFLGIVSSVPFRRVEFDVENPFNVLFHADNVSFASVPEPASTGVCLIALAATIGISLRRPVMPSQETIGHGVE